MNPYHFTIFDYEVHYIISGGEITTTIKELKRMAASCLIVFRTNVLNFGGALLSTCINTLFKVCKIPSIWKKLTNYCPLVLVIFSLK